MPAARPDPRTLMERAWKQLGKPTKVDFYRELGLDPAHAAQRWRRVVEEGGELHYYETWAMLDALDWVQPELRPVAVAERLVRRLDAGETGLSRAELEQAAKPVERVAANLARLVDRLREGAQAAQQAR